MFKLVDLQTIMPRTIDLQRAQQIQNNRPLSDQQEFARDAVKQAEARQEQVQHNEASVESNRIHDDALDDSKNRERRYRRYNPKKRLAAETETNDETSDSDCGQHIDIKI